MNILKFLINYLKDCCGNDEKAKEKRKKIFIIGLGILGLRVSLKLLYKIKKFMFFVFGRDPRYGLRFACLIVLLLIAFAFIVIHRQLVLHGIF